jgi:prepilin-type N-terminal cleavage/methylation domain-containing protein
MMRRLIRGFRKGEKGFTLIELLVVIAILGIIAAIVVPNFGNFFGRGQTEACQIEERMVKTITIAYASDNGSCPSSLDDLSDYFEDPDAIVGSYSFSGEYPNCTVDQDDPCPAEAEPEA